MRFRVFNSRTQSSSKCAVLFMDKHCAFAGGGALVNTEHVLQGLLFEDILHFLANIVLSDASEVGAGVGLFGLQHPLIKLEFI